VPALGALRDPIAPGHYRLTHHAEHRPWTAAEGPGRIAIADLDSRAVAQLVDAGRAMRRGSDALLEIDGVAGTVGGLGARAGAAIHGGGPGDDALAPFQRLAAPASSGVRVRNDDLVRLVGLLFGTPSALRIAVFSVLDDT
jgi:hypothetical protein